jgi:hypothetical protein
MGILVIPIPKFVYLFPLFTHMLAHTRHMQTRCIDFFHQLEEDLLTGKVDPSVVMQALQVQPPPHSTPAHPTFRSKSYLSSMSFLISA